MTREEYQGICDMRFGKEVYEWNGTNGYIDFETKTPMQEECTLEQMLEELKGVDLLERKIILLKDITAYLNEPKIVSKLKMVIFAKNVIKSFVLIKALI